MEAQRQGDHRQNKMIIDALYFVKLLYGYIALIGIILLVDYILNEKR
jgi:uncharacterized membrane protein